MLQQTTVKAVGPYFARFLARWPDVACARGGAARRRAAAVGRARLLRARPQPACLRAGGGGARRLSAQRKPSSRRCRASGATPRRRSRRSPSTPSTVPVDGNVERVVTRLFAVEEELPAAKPEIHRLAQTLAPDARAGDFAQALMDLGATICTPVKPACALCPWMDGLRGAAARRSADVSAQGAEAGRASCGAARRSCAVRADGCVLLRSRPPKGLLGGMTEVPTTRWSHDFDDKRCAAQVRRASHAPRRSGGACRAWSRMCSRISRWSLSSTRPRCRATPARPTARAGSRSTELPGEALPTVMRKVLAHALED